MMGMEAVREAFQEGLRTARRDESICENPWWPNYPKPAPGGPLEEHMARAFVDGWVAGQGGFTDEENASARWDQLAGMWECEE